MSRPAARGVAGLAVRASSHRLRPGRGHGRVGDGRRGGRGARGLRAQLTAAGTPGCDSMTGFPRRRVGYPSWVAMRWPEAGCLDNARTGLAGELR
jgi:hypothetical protein